MNPQYSVARTAQIDRFLRRFQAANLPTTPRKQCRSVLNDKTLLMLAQRRDADYATVAKLQSELAELEVI